MFHKPAAFRCNSELRGIPTVALHCGAPCGGVCRGGSVESSLLGCDGVGVTNFALVCAIEG